MIHPTAIIDPSATIASNTTVGPYCVIGANVNIGSGCELKSHVVIDGITDIGDNNTFFPFAAIGQLTQDLKYQGEPTTLKIGNNNTFRENTTVHRSTTADTTTTIGDNNLLLAYSHVAHDCIVGSHCILSNAASLAGHVVVEDHVIVSGMSGVHQFCRLGAHAIIGGMAKIVQDVPPFVIADGTPAAARSINLIGLQRRGFEQADISALKSAYKKLFFRKNTNLKESLDTLKEDPLKDNPFVAQLIAFVESSERGITR